MRATTKPSAGVIAALGAIGNKLALGLDRMALQQAMPAGAARNALDCAFWDLEAKRAGKPVHELAGLARAAAAHHRLHDLARHARDDGGGGRAPPPRESSSRSSSAAPGDPERIAAVRAAAPQSELIVDANEGWTADNLADNLAACATAGVTLVEQPLPADDDAALASIRRPIPVCADESVHDRAGLAALVGRYDAVNIKLDKTGGLTEALAMAAEARAARLRHHGRLHGRDLARDGAGRAAGAAARAWSISTARCCWRRTAPTGYATRAVWFIRRRPRCGGDR